MTSSSKLPETGTKVGYTQLVGCANWAKQWRGQGARRSLVSWAESQVHPPANARKPNTGSRTNVSRSLQVGDPSIGIGWLGILCLRWIQPMRLPESFD